MTWSYDTLLNLLEESRNQLRSVSQPVEEDETLTWLREVKPIESKAADAACEVFAECQSWPNMQIDRVVAQVHLRLTNAISLCQGLRHQALPAVRQREILRRLLLDYWHSRVAGLLDSDQTTDDPAGN